MKLSSLLNVFLAIAVIGFTIFGIHSCKKKKNYGYTYPYTFTYSGCPYAGSVIQFGYNNNYEPASTFQWNFGDGTTSNDANPTHTYAQPGIYTVTLIINDDVPTADSHKIQVLSPNVGSPYTALMSGLRLWNGQDQEYQPTSLTQIVDSPIAVEVIDSGTISFLGNTLHIVYLDTLYYKYIIYSGCSGAPALYYYYNVDSIEYTNLRPVGKGSAGLTIHTP